MRGRRLVGAALTQAERLATESKEPACLVIDAHGQICQRMVAWVGEQGADRHLVEVVSAQELPADAAAMALVRVDDGLLRVLGWDLAQTARAISYPVLDDDGRPIDWRRGWLEQFDETLRGRERDRARVEAAAEDEVAGNVRHLAAVALDFFERELPTTRERAAQVPAIIGAYNGQGRAVLNRAPAEPLDTVLGIGEILARMRRAMRTAGHARSITVFRWRALEELSAGQHQFVLAGFDHGEDLAIAYLLRVSEGENGLALDEVSQVPADLLESWLIEGEQRLETRP